MGRRYRDRNAHLRGFHAVAVCVYAMMGMCVRCMYASEPQANIYFRYCGVFSRLVSSPLDQVRWNIEHNNEKYTGLYWTGMEWRRVLSRFARLGKLENKLPTVHIHTYTLDVPSDQLILSTPPR